jgi:hypothetical protein
MDSYIWNPMEKYMRMDSYGLGWIPICGILWRNIYGFLWINMDSFLSNPTKFRYGILWSPMDSDGI